MNQSPTLLALGENSTLQELKIQLAQKNISLFLYNPLEIEPLSWDFSSIAPNEIKKNFVISLPAFTYGLKKILPQLSSDTEIFTVGEATASAIKKETLLSVFTPDHFTSEALLALPQLQSLQGEKIWLFKGKGGRSLLEETLRSRQAQLNIIECYRRIPKKTIPTQLVPIWQESQVKYLLVSSHESLLAFIQQVPNHWLKTLEIIVTSVRLEEAAQAEGFRHIYRAPHFAVPDLLQTIGMLYDNA